ncbi:GNAT family N-acetyltransferase [Paenirhodobacter hankyongi]|uniref:N-acetyltransferase n=1 Tax=Paenirhodobacter hankyongi TaxID=2294033 RepID=A0A421BPD9_9RHOB|nr:GNAT family N-acetyltransferase [Sinirhodobacter hankyongi]RLL64731.1 N-acetyltransferase [Sinirhodobacter hankyongi]
MTILLDIPVIETERLVLRAPGTDDLPAMYDFYDSERSRFVGGPCSHEQAWRSLAMEIGHWALRGYGRWSVVEKASGEIVGMVGIFNPEGWFGPEIGWDLYTGFEGRGYATEAGRAARAYAYDTLGMSSVVSLTRLANEQSARVAQRLGAVLEGTFQHERHGMMNVWRHPSAAQLKEMAA